MKLQTPAYRLFSHSVWTDMFTNVLNKRLTHVKI